MSLTSEERKQFLEKLKYDKEFREQFQEKVSKAAKAKNHFDHKLFPDSMFYEGESHMSYHCTYPGCSNESRSSRGSYSRCEDHRGVSLPGITTVLPEEKEKEKEVYQEYIEEVEVELPADDPINPTHYTRFNKTGQSALQVTEAWELGYHLGQTVKYIQRAGLKPGVSELEDLKKAQWFLQRKIYLLDPSEPNPMKDDINASTE